jgi:hypothetical protein
MKDVRHFESAASSSLQVDCLPVCLRVLFFPVEKQSGKYVCVNVRVAFLFLFFIHLCSIFVFKNAFGESEQEGDGPMNRNFV